VKPPGNFQRSLAIFLLAFSMLTVTTSFRPFRRARRWLLRM
jgi:hypothetical protein